MIMTCYESGDQVRLLSRITFDRLVLLGRVLASPLGGIMTNNDDTSKTFVIALSLLSSLSQI